MNTVNFRVKYRPLRVGWCVPKGDIESLKKALFLTHTLWGGRYNPIIPVDDSELGERLVKLFNVDILVQIKETPEIKEFIKRFEYLPNFGIFLINENIDEINKKLIDLYHPLRKIYDDDLKPDAQFKITIFDWDESDPLDLVFLTTFGKFQQNINYNYKKFIIENLGGEIQQIGNDTEFPKDIFKKYSINRISSYELTQHHSIWNYYGDAGFYIGNANDFMDLINYWNIRATDADVYFFDSNFLNRFEGFKNSYLEFINKIKDQNVFSFFGDKLPIFIGEHSEIKESDFENKITTIGVSTDLWNGLNIKAPIMHFEEKLVKSIVGDFYGKKGVSFLLPEKPTKEKHSKYFNMQHIVVSLIPTHFRNDFLIFNPPFIPVLNKFYGKEIASINWYNFRVEPEGFGIIIKTFEDELTIYPLEKNKLIKKLFTLVEIQAGYSKPGLLAQRIIEQFGEIQDCRVFKIKGVRELIQKNIVFNKDKALQTIGENNFTKFKGLCIEERNKKKLEPLDVLIYLLKKKVFNIGLEFECPYCFLKYWISIDNLKKETECEFCGNIFNTLPLLIDRDWKYRKTGLFENENISESLIDDNKNENKEDHQEGSIPVILTLQQINTHFSHNDYIFSTALDLKSKIFSNDKCEIDFLIICKDYENKPQLVIGECKNKCEINEKDIKNLHEIAKSFENIGYDVFIIVSKLKEFTLKELELLKNLNSEEEYRERLILFTDRHLEPYNIYEDEKLTLGPDINPQSFEEMVEITKKIFLK